MPDGLSYGTSWSLLAEFPPLIVRQESRYQQKRTPRSLSSGAETVAQPMWNLDGVAWHEADPPRPRHSHWAQTVGLMDGPRDEVRRCPCGATWLLGGWLAERDPRVEKGASWLRRLGSALGIGGGEQVEDR